MAWREEGGVLICETPREKKDEKIVVPPKDDGAVILKDCKEQKTGSGGFGKTIQKTMEAAERARKQ